MYENYLANPGSVPDTWRSYFDALQHVPAGDGTDARDVPHHAGHQCVCGACQARDDPQVVLANPDSEMGRKRVVHTQQLIAAYRNVRRSRWADLDPLKRTERDHIPELEPVFLRLD
jgi:2-oxoglutarate dehydrogenase E1 component